ncbi:probable cytochrome P450 6a14 [Ctenocephalides felis]|uniref:probable cytochrome P450 6a14 n=1 Tax=Ctenocephalides felis TaxID=7515 RepID=UPI000E6E201D|nr:probable cytochrome P450 6a14 [Ctenocephalides felis]
MLEYILILPLGIVAFLYFYTQKHFQYWAQKGVKHEKPVPIFGNVKDIMLMRSTTGQGMQRLYNLFPDEPFIGVYQSKKPVLLIRDPELIKQVLVKDFQHFPNRGIVSNHKLDPLSENLFNMEGQKWKDLRHKLTPTFTSGKLKSMFASLAECGKEFNSYLKEITAEQNIFEMLDLSGNFTTQVIGSCVFGININSIKDPDSEFRKMGKKAFEPSPMVFVKRFIRSTTPALFRLLKMKVIAPEVENFFLTVVKDMLDYRTKNNVKRADFLQILMDLKEQELQGINQDKQLNFKMDDNLLAAQMFVFFVAGFETSSTTMSFCLYELALNCDIQKRVHEEIDEVLEQHDGNLSYESVLQLEYLEQVISETMRKHSPAGNLIRKCEIPYIIPDTKITLKKGDSIIIPVHALHHDPKYFPSPEQFDPERFSKEAKESRHPYCYLPFGEGPRICIGLRFAKFQTAVGLISILQDFEVVPCEETEIPLTYNPKNLVLRAKHGIRLRLKRRSDKNIMD